MPLKIAITADPEIPVPPLLYGGIERIIDMLIKGYVQRGHEVSLFAHKDSVVPAKLHAYPGNSSGNKKDFLKNSWLINKTLFTQKFDIIHSFGRLAYLLPQLPLKTPKLMSYQREPTLGQIQKAARISRNTLAFTGCSDYISKQIAPYAPSFTVYNGVPLKTYQFKAEVAEDAPFVFLGRIEPIKGTHLAVQMAKETNSKLIIAGNIPADKQSYFDQEIAPHLGEQIQYIGPVNDIQKNELLGKAKAFLMPILWDEPFGIVMAEAMACGTPVLGLKRGSVPEVVINGENGFYAESVDELTNLSKRIDEIDRRKVRLDCEKRFSSEVIIEEYLSIYQKLINK